MDNGLLKIEESNGKFGQFGGAFIPELLKPAFDEITQAFEEFKSSQQHQDCFKYLLKNYEMIHLFS
jgi:tryptophan synthase beta chain